jgi:hypothetical protein
LNPEPFNEDEDEDFDDSDEISGNEDVEFLENSVMLEYLTAIYDKVLLMNQTTPNDNHSLFGKGSNEPFRLFKY